MTDQRTIRLDWQRLLGFDQAEITPADLKDQRNRTALMAKLSSKPGLAKAKRTP
ncbi:MAG: hypothetical protein AAGE01_16290 [Pseudomonadota bacterium]